MKERPKKIVQPLFKILKVRNRKVGKAESNPSSAKAKAFLNLCKKLSNPHYILPVSQQIPLNLTLENIIPILQTELLQIKRNGKASLQKIQDLLYIAKLLKTLLEIFVNRKNSSKQGFYKFCDKSLGISPKTYTSYQCYFKFHMKYSRFQHVPISFTKWRENYPAVKTWFESAASLQLLPSDPYSESYWKNIGKYSKVNAKDPDVQILSITKISGGNIDLIDNLFSNLSITKPEVQRRDSGVEICDIIMET